MKKLMSMILASALLLTSFGIVYAGQGAGEIISESAIYLNGDFKGHNAMIVEGSIHAKAGDAKFDAMAGNIINGNILLDSNKKLVLEDENVKPEISGTVSKTDGLTFPYEAPVIPEFPTNISKNVENFTADSTTDSVVNESTHYTKLNIKNFLKIDTTNGDVVIAVDRLSMSANSYIEIIGAGKVTFFVKGSLDLSSGGIKINPAGDPNRLSIITNKNMSLGDNTFINANIYNGAPNLNIYGMGTINGNLFTNASKLSMASGGVLNGLLYAPITDSVVACSSTINGVVITKTLDMYKNSRISYGPISTDIVIPPAAETPVDPAPVDPTEPTDPTEPPVNDIPVGNEVFINFQYAYLYGYDNEKMTVGAEDPITREEAAALLYRLLKQDNKLGDFTPTASTFKDISDTHWSKNALMYMKHIGVYTGDMVYQTREISRGEVAKTICFALRIQPDSTKTIEFSDLKPTNQYYWYIKALVDKGILEGFDGKINPDTSITRAEYVASLNRLLGRGDNYMIDNYKEIYNSFYDYKTVVDGQIVQAHKNHYGHFICTNDSIYPDLTDKNYWAYDEIMRASLGFTDVPVGGVYLVDPEKKPDRSFIDYN